MTVNPFQSRPWPVVVPVALALLLRAQTATHAMVVTQRDFPEIVARAEQIVVGTVADIRSHQDEAGIPFTLVTVSDLTVVKGDVGPTLTLRFYGGPAGDTIVHIPDMPAFTVGERALLFVAGNGRAICPLVGVWQGRFRVRFDAARGTEVVESNDGRPVTGVSSGKVLHSQRRAKTGAAAALALSDFLELIADELAHPAAGSAPPR